LNNHFLRIAILYQHFGSVFPICSLVLCMPISIIFLGGFLTQGFHCHFIQVWYFIGGSFGRNVVCINSSSHFPSYCSNPPYLCFSFVGKWFTHSWSCIKHVTWFFVVIRKVWSIMTFNVVEKMCSLVSTKVRPIYITSSKLYCIWVLFSYCKCSDGLFVICGILCITSTLRGPQHNH
jgi:hypothetical protein